MACSSVVSQGAWEWRSCEPSRGHDFIPLTKAKSGAQRRSTELQGVEGGCRRELKGWRVLWRRQLLKGVWSASGN